MGRRLMLEGTYSINNYYCGMPLYAFFGAGWAYGHGQLVGLCLLAGEDAGGARGSDAGGARNQQSAK